MKYFRKFGRRRVQRKRGIKRARPVSKVSQSVRRYVKRAIHRQIENKEIMTYTANQSISAAESGLTTPTVLGLLPAIYNGTDNHDRIGNTVKMVKGHIRGYVNIKPYDAVNNPRPAPVYIKMWIVRHLGIQGQIAAPWSGFDWTTFFRGNGIDLGFQNNPLDLCLQVNEAYWKVEASKTLKIGASSYSSTGPVSSGSYFDNSSMSKGFYFNFGNKIKKVLKFNDGETNLPTNHNLYLVVQCVQADGSSAVTPAEWHYVVEHKYEDA